MFSINLFDALVHSTNSFIIFQMSSHTHTHSHAHMPAITHTTWLASHWDFARMQNIIHIWNIASGLLLMMIQWIVAPCNIIATIFIHCFHYYVASISNASAWPETKWNACWDLFFKPNYHRSAQQIEIPFQNDRADAWVSTTTTTIAECIPIL